MWQPKFQLGSVSTSTQSCYVSLEDPLPRRSSWRWPGFPEFARNWLYWVEYFQAPEVHLLHSLNGNFKVASCLSSSKCSTHIHLLLEMMKTIGTFDVSFLASNNLQNWSALFGLTKKALVFPPMASPRHGNDALPLNPSHLTRLTETMTEATRQKCSKKNKACSKHGSVVKLPDVRISMHPSHTFFQPRCCIRSGGCPQCCSWQCIYQCILYIRSILTGSRIYSLLYIYIYMDIWRDVLSVLWLFHSTTKTKLKQYYLPWNSFCRFFSVIWTTPGLATLFTFPSRKLLLQGL